MDIHDHCRSCHLRHCDFDVIDDVSCEIVSCPNECGQRFHKCKSEGHFEVCSNHLTPCINKMYGCPTEMQRSELARHLEVCPASVVLCTMEWSRWNCRSLIVEENNQSKVRQLKNLRTVDHDFDIACAVHDQRILLETIMPENVLKYYSDIADEQNDDVIDPIEDYGNDEVQKQVTVSSPLVTSDLALEEKPVNEESVTPACEDRCFVKNESSKSDLLAQKKLQPPENCDSVVPATQTCPNIPRSAGDNSAVGPTTEKPHTSPSDSGELPQQPSSSDQNNSAGVNEETIKKNESTQKNEPKSRRSKISSRLKNRSWLFDYATVGSSANILSQGWMPRKECRDACTDTSDLVIDTSTLEWLSPEISISKDDLLSKLFSMLGSISKRGSAASEKQTSHYMAESASQTVVPFLLNVDLNAVGRQLRSYTLSSSSCEERKKMRALLTTCQFDDDNSEPGYFNISENLAYHSLGISAVADSLSSYRAKPFSMYSFMCGCSFRRDQFSSHVQNVHCETMSWMNGWIEQKCPYSIYGCTYTTPRFCPGNSNNAIIYKPNLGCFAMSHDHWSKKIHRPLDTKQDCPLLNIPFEMHEMLLHYLDSFSLNQLSLSCKYFREICRSRLVSRGVVEVKWVKREDETGWEFGEKIWHFPIAFEKIHKWVPSDSPFMAQHIPHCEVKADQDSGLNNEPLKVIFSNPPP